MSRRLQTAVQIGSNPPAPSNGDQCVPKNYLGDVETYPGPTTTHDICHKQIHGRKQISIRCNRIEHWVNLRGAGIRLAQYTYTWTCHLHKESGLTTHTDKTPPTPTYPGPSPIPIPTPILHHRNPNTRSTLPLFPQDW